MNGDILIKLVIIKSFVSTDDTDDIEKASGSEVKFANIFYKCICTLIQMCCCANLDKNEVKRSKVKVTTRTIWSKRRRHPRRGSPSSSF